jgi:hypothetical protein
MAVCGDFFYIVAGDAWYCDMYKNSLWKKDPRVLGTQ